MFLFLRYSHDSLIIEDNLILFGGVNRECGHEKPGLCVVNLKNNSTAEYSLPVNMYKLSSFILLNSIS